MSEHIDLGHDHHLRYVGWRPDRALNPQYEHLEDEERTGAIVSHLLPDDSPCEGFVHFDTPVNRALGHEPRWTVESWEPLTLAPSLLCSCGDHGFVRDGQWVAA